MMLSFSKTFTIGKRKIGEGQKTYFIADIGANFDGSLEKAKKLAYECKQAGADVAKIQSFKAKKIVSGKGFSSMKLKGVHGSWKRPVEDVFKEAEFPRKWHQEFFDYCWKIGITPSSSPYDYEAVDLMEACGTEFYKIGSGDITWLEMVDYIARKGKPVVLATGAATLSEIDEAVRTIEKRGKHRISRCPAVHHQLSFQNRAPISMCSKPMQNAFNTIIGYFWTNSRRRYRRAGRGGAGRQGD